MLLKRFVWKTQLVSHLHFLWRERQTQRQLDPLLFHRTPPRKDPIYRKRPRREQQQDQEAHQKSVTFRPPCIQQHLHYISADSSGLSNPRHCRSHIISNAKSRSSGDADLITAFYIDTIKTHAFVSFYHGVSSISGPLRDAWSAVPR